MRSGILNSKDKVRAIVYTMKMIILALIMAAVPMLTSCGNGLFSRSPQISGITHFSYAVFGGMTVDYGYDYSADLVDGKVIVKHRPNGEPEENTITLETDASFMDELRAIIEKYKLNKWDGFHGNNKFNVTDGDYFSLRVEMDNGQTISAGGYMAYPKNYSAATSEIVELFDTLFSD